MLADFEVNGVKIADTFAEAFPMVYSRALVTAQDDTWLTAACQAVTGFATSVIGCGVEAGVETYEDATPDGRRGANLLFFAMNEKRLEEQLTSRLGQAVMTCPTTAVFNAGDSDRTMKIGAKLKYFGDGFQSSKVIDGKRYWRIPVMEGEFVIEETFCAADGIGGGNFLILADSDKSALEAAKKAVEAIKPLPGVILPFPGGVVRSGSRVGSRYKFLKASTNAPYCPTIRRQVDTTQLPEGVNSVMEIVIDGVSENAIATAMRAGITSALDVAGVIKIDAGNYGGGLGPFHFRLRDVLNGAGQDEDTTSTLSRTN